MTEISPARVVITVPSRPDPVAAIERLDIDERVVADDRLGDEQLEVGATVGDGEEDELAGVALEHDATADGDDDVGLLARSEVGAELAHLGGAVRAVEPVGIGLPSGGTQLVDLPLAASALGGEAAARRASAVVAGCRVCGVGLGHGARRYRVSLRAAVPRGLATSR